MEIVLPSSVTADHASPKMSEKYVHIRTSDILARFMDHGWSVAQVNAPKYSKLPQYARHALRLRHKDFGLDADSAIPELIILNSHNGTWKLRIALGIFRVVCSNGMVAGSLWEGISLKHCNIKDVEEKVEQVTGQISDLSDRVGSAIHQWSQVEVPIKEQLDFAQKAIAIRWKEATPVTPDQMLEARRDADRGSDLWHVFNRVQENLTQGGFSGTNSRGIGFNIKAIKNVKRDYKYNAELFDLAASYAKEQ